MIAVVEECGICFAAAPWRAVLEIAMPIDDVQGIMGIRRIYLSLCYCDDHKGWLALCDLSGLLPINVTFPTRIAFQSLNGHAEIRFVEAWAKPSEEDVDARH